MLVFDLFVAFSENNLHKNFKPLKIFTVNLTPKSCPLFQNDGPTFEIDI